MVSRSALFGVMDSDTGGEVATDLAVRRRVRVLEAGLEDMRAELDQATTLARVRGAIVDAQKVTITTLREQAEIDQRRVEEWRNHARHLSVQLKRLQVLHNVPATQSSTGWWPGFGEQNSPVESSA